MKNSYKSLVFTPVLLALAAMSAQAAPISVDINRTPIELSPPPIERAGRVFVPLRGIFERLGATVAYQGGTINATGSDRTISLHIGSTLANVSGVDQQLDVAPFILGASTYVPLRFVAQALGAHVFYDGNRQLVAVTTANSAAEYASHPVATPTPSSIGLVHRQPAENSVVAADKPTIAADFSKHVDPNTLHIMLDGLDITGSTTRSETGMIYAPPSPLQASSHEVVVTGRDQQGTAFRRAWSFTSGTEVKRNFLRLESPVAGSTVSSNFTVHGKTAPNSRVHIIAGATASLKGVFTMGTGDVSVDTLADGDGEFIQNVSLSAVSGGTITVSITSTDPATHATAQSKVEVLVQ